MKHQFQGAVILILVAGMQLTSCTTSPEPAQEIAPAEVTHLGGNEITQVVLTADAARRIDVQTAAVETQEVEGVQRDVVPFAAIVYDTQGGTWVYTNPEPLTYIRTAVQVEFVREDNAVLLAGPRAGTAVVTVGAEELFGSETEFEEE